MNNSRTLLTSKKSHTRLLLSVTACLCAGLAIAAVSGNKPTTADKPTAAVAELKATGKAFADVTKRVSPAVVFVQVEKKQSATPAAAMPFENLPEGLDQDLLKKFFGDRLPKSRMPEHPRHTQGQGSGFIVSKDGYILTNNHVVGDADKVTVRLVDGREFDAKLIGADRHTDVAIIKIDAEDLTVLPMGDSDVIEVGEWVLAVGSPFGLPGTVTSGIVSAKGRNRVGITNYENFIQTDAAINPGNSGGPLVNLDGEVVGINTAIFSRSGGYMGIGFAIPINMARNVYNQLIEHGSVTRGYLGIVIQPLTSELAESFGLDSNVGILISDVAKDSPAEKAGLKSGDVIVELDAADVKDIGAFRNRVSQLTPQSDASLTVLRGGARQAVKVRIGTLPGSTDMAPSENDESSSLGFSVRPLTEDLAAKHGYSVEDGVIVTEIEAESRADLAGLRRGMLIREVNREKVKSVEDFHRLVKQNEGGTSLLLLVTEGKFSRYLVLKMED